VTNDFNVTASDFGLAFGSPLAETDAMPMPPSFKHDSIFIDFDSEMGAVQCASGQSFAKFNPAHGRALPTVIQFESRN
jgi:hypothetical protein